MGPDAGGVAMKPADFRAELVKIMPGYTWTVHKTPKHLPHTELTATGIMSSGFNRISTLEVARSEAGGRVRYRARSAGHGTKSEWAHCHTDGTLARALRGLQDHYQRIAGENRALASRLKEGRQMPGVEIANG